MKTKIKTIDIEAKEWFDKANGNSYFSGIVTTNYGMKSQKSIDMSFQYGYGDQYKEQGLAQLMNLHLIPTTRTSELRDLGIILRYCIRTKCTKKEVKEFAK